MKQLVRRPEPRKKRKAKTVVVDVRTGVVLKGTAELSYNELRGLALEARAGRN